eukprot:274553_1
MSFSTGFVFFYWNYYKNITDEKFNRDMSSGTLVNDNDFNNGYPIYQLFVEKHYCSLKDEMLSSQFVTATQWQTKVVLKAEEYYCTSEAIKKLTCDWNIDQFHYGISYNDKISLSHLQSVILYCDFTDLSSSFTSTFRRKKHMFETLKSIKHRNSMYWWLSKLLTETVQYFGTKSVRGPFFCGMSSVINISAFAIRVNGPCSTSKCKEIAITFAQKHGIILILQNDHVSSHSDQRCFDCSIISKYCEEDERFFIAGQYRLRMQSVCIIETQQNFEIFFHAFYLFDCMLSGINMNAADIYGIKVTSVDFEILSKLMSNKLGNTCFQFDPYITNSFEIFLNRKTEISIEMVWLDKYFKNLTNLIMNDVMSFDINFLHTELITQKDSISKSKDFSLFDLMMNSKTNCNLLKQQTFQLFPNIKKVTLYTTCGPQNSTYVFSLLSFLSVIESCKPSVKIITIKESGTQTRRNPFWLLEMFSLSIKQAYNKQNWEIELTIHRLLLGNECELTIRRI